MKKNKKQATGTTIVFIVKCKSNPLNNVTFNPTNNYFDSNNENLESSSITPNTYTNEEEDNITERYL